MAYNNWQAYIPLKPLQTETKPKKNLELWPIIYLPYQKTDGGIA
jgi:hypothetical protein